MFASGGGAVTTEPRRRATVLFAAALLQGFLLSSLIGCSIAPGVADAERPADWAQSVAAGPAIPNLHRVSAALYRSGQPTPEGLRLLQTRAVLSDGDPPIRTVLSLREFHADLPAGQARPSFPAFERIKMASWHPEHEDAIRFLRIVTDPAAQPVLVHCRHGADRTGTMIAVYRIVIEGWSKKAALREMTQGGYGFHPVWQDLVRFVEDLDIEAIRTELARP
jgi:hypothetical protein